MRWLLRIIAGLTVLVVLAFVVGMALPKEHVASVRAHYSQPPPQIFQTILDVEHAPDWRSGLDSVRILTRDERPLRWQESSKFGTMTFVLDDVQPPARLVSRIADESQGFGGKWTYEIAPDANGSVVTITENGEVHNPLFRFMSRFVFGHYRTLELYAKDLGRKFGEDVQPERVTE
jgi:uncharacterized protein YndB with AHSA1/START domain